MSYLQRDHPSRVFAEIESLESLECDGGRRGDITLWLGLRWPESRCQYAYEQVHAVQIDGGSLELGEG